jgi:hypothetical protein
MTIADFNRIVENMKTVYNFDDQKTQIISIEDNMKRVNVPCRLEVTTLDETTGVRITMSRSAYNDEDPELWKGGA